MLGFETCDKRLAAPFPNESGSAAIPMYGNVATSGSSESNAEQQLEPPVDWMKALRPKTVLCVDDEKIGLKVRKIMLEGHGFKVLTATSGEQGLALLAENH